MNFLLRLHCPRYYEFSLNFEALHAIYITTGGRPTATSVIHVQVKQGHQFQIGLHFLSLFFKKIGTSHRHQPILTLYHLVAGQTIAAFELNQFTRPRPAVVKTCDDHSVILTGFQFYVCCSCCGPKKCYPSFRSSCILSLTRLMVVVRTTKSYSLYCFSSLGLLCLALHAFTSAVICGALRCGRL